MMAANDLSALEERAGEVAGAMRALANEKRLLILCQLSAGEMSVGTLADAVGLSQSALSQHLARMRDDGIVDFRREAQSVKYRIADKRISELMQTLYGLYCSPVT
jgi:ArsR family transcriptional regulator